MTISLPFIIQRENGTSIDADATPTIVSVERTDTGAIIVQNEPAIRSSIGRYYYTLTIAQPGIAYRYTVSAMVQGTEFNVIKTITAPPPVELPIPRQEMKDWLKVEGSDEDELIDGLILAADDFICDEANVFVVCFDLPSNRLALKLLVGHWYLHRESVNIGNITSEISQGLRDIINHNRSVPVV